MQLCPNRAGSIPHHAQTHPRLVWSLGLKSDPVVADPQTQLAGVNRQLDVNLPGVPVFNGIMNRFLSDAIQGRTRARVNLHLRIPAMQQAIDVEKVLGLRQ